MFDCLVKLQNFSFLKINLPNQFIKNQLGIGSIKWFKIYFYLSLIVFIEHKVVHRMKNYEQQLK